MGEIVPGIHEAYVSHMCVLNKRSMGLDVLLKNQLAHGPKFQKLHIHSLSNPGCRNWAYFHSMGSGFWDNGWFSKLPYLAMKLGHWPEFQKWHIYSLSNPGARNWAHSRSTGSSFQDTGRFSNLPYLCMKLGKWPKFTHNPTGSSLEKLEIAQSEGEGKKRQIYRKNNNKRYKNKSFPMVGSYVMIL